ncbi:META domain-containing protein [Pseudooceanicola sp. 502str34]
MKLLTPALLALLSTCATSGPELADPSRTWHLETLNGAPFTSRATLVLDEARFSGRAPCNSYFGGWSGTYPAFSSTQIGATRMACPDLAEEDAFLKALGAANQARMDDGRLILTGPDDHELVFAEGAPAD